MAARTYTTIQGDMYDLIGFKMYGDDHLGNRIMEANYDYHLIRIFSGGIALVLPDIKVKRRVALVDWKEAVVVP